MKIPTKKNSPEFIWHGVNQQGQRMQGTLGSKNLVMAKAQLRRKGIIVKKLQRKSPFLLILNRKKITAANIAAFSRQLATLLAAGIPLVKGLEIIAKSSEHQDFTTLVNNIKTTIENGSTFAEALNKYPSYFDSLFFSLVDAGEQSGTLDIMLERIATYREKTETIKKKVRKALSYPIAVMVVAVIVSTVLLVKVIPQFETLFTSVGSTLPLFTQVVISISNIFQQYWWLIMLALIFSVAGFTLQRKRSLQFKHVTDSLFLKIPLLGKLLQKAAIARFCRTLATTFAAGMPLLNALKVSSKAAGNMVYQAAILDLRESISGGEQFHVAMNVTGRFPNMVVQMAAIGEESGELDAMMNKAATIYEEDVSTIVDSLNSLLEPMIMGILGVLIGGLVIAMYLPIFQMGKAF